MKKKLNLISKTTNIRSPKKAGKENWKNMKISEIDQALTVYQNWIISTDYDEIDVVIIRQVIQRCKELERKNLGLKKQIENMRRKEEARYKSDAWVD